MGVLHLATGAFKRRANALNDKKVDLAVNLHDYVFLRVKNPLAAKANEWIAVPLRKFPDARFEKDDMVRFKLTSIPVYEGQLPNGICYEVAKIERLEGQIKVLPVTRVEYMPGHPYARRANP
jgi:hypothetical protein